MSVSVGEFVRQRLKENEDGIKTMKELAAKAGVNPTYLSRVIKGHINASPAFLKAIAPHLQGTSLQELMSVAGHLPDYDGTDGETLEDLEVRIKDLVKLLSDAMLKYTEQRFAADGSEITYIKARNNANTQQVVLHKLLETVIEGNSTDEFGFVMDDNIAEWARDYSKLSEHHSGLIRVLMGEFLKDHSQEKVKTPPSA